MDWQPFQFRDKIPSATAWLKKRKFGNKTVKNEELRHFIDTTKTRI